MGYTQRASSSSADSITTYDSTTLAPGAYTAAATLGCNDVMTCCLVAVKGAGALVQSRSSATALGSFSGAALAFLNPTVAGNCIIVSLEFSASFPLATPTVTDSQGNTYTQIQFGHPGGSGHFGGTWIAFGIGAGANTVTVSLTGFGVPGDAICLAISEYTGGSSVDAHTENALVGGGTLTLSLSTTSAGDLLYLGIGIGRACGGSPSGVTGGNPLIPPSPPTAWLIVNEPSIGFTDRTSYLEDNGNHSFNLQLRQRGKASYTLVSNPTNSQSAPTSYQSTVGQPIYLFDQNLTGYTLMFAGLVQDFTERFVGNHGLRYVDVTAVSLESVIDTIYAQPMQFVNQKCGAILTALFNAFESGSPVSLGLIQDGATIPLFNANKGDKLSDLFDQLATTSEFVWGVNPQTQQLYFQLPSVTAAPFTVTSANVLWDSISRKYDAGDYRNRQGVRLSFDAFPHSQEGFTGPGASLDFTLMRPVKQVVGAYITTATPNTATGAFSGQPSPGDTVTIGPATGAWQGPHHIYGLNGVIVVNGFVQKVTTAGTSGLTQPTFSTVTGGTTVDNSMIWTCQGPLGLGTGSNTYTFVASLDNTQFGQVLIGGTLAETVQNLVDALNAVAPYSGTPATKGRGLTFSLPTWETSQINAITVTGTGFTATQKIPGSGWIAGLTSVGSAFSWSAANTSGGTSPQTSVGPNEPAWLSIPVYQIGTATTAPGLGYTEGSAVVHLATPLNAGTNLSVEYTRTDGDVIEVENTSLVAALAVISAGTGKYQQFTDQSSTGLVSTSAAAGLQLAQEILATYATVPQELSIELYRPGVLPGQILTLALTSPLDAVNGTYFVQEVAAELVPGLSGTGLDSVSAPNAGHYKYTIKLININQIGTAIDLWRLLGGGGGTAGGGGGGGSQLVATSGSTGEPGGLGPGGSSPQVQYNTGAQLGGITGATSDGTNLAVTTQAPGDNTTKAASTAFVQAAIGSGGLPANAQNVFDETPAGTVNGSNVTFTLANAPNPAASLQLFQNGILAIQGTDYTLSGLTITMTSAPSTGTLLNAFYRYGSAPGVFVDDETPAGAVNSSNVTFALANAPSPATSLRLFDNGVLQIQGTDYTISGLTITMTSAPTTGDQLIAYYVYSVSGTNYADNETPAGTVNGSNVTFGLAHTPNPAAGLNLYVNGVLQLFGTDFTLATATITFASAPSTGAILTAFYRY